MFRQKEQLNKWLDENIRILLINTRINHDANDCQKCVIVNINKGEQMNKNDTNIGTVSKDVKWNKEVSKKKRK